MTGLYSPWGDLPACNTLRIAGVNFSFPVASPDAPEEPAAVRRISAAGDHPAPGRLIPTGGKPAETISGQRADGVAAVSAGDLSIAGLLARDLSDGAKLFLRLIAAHHRCDLARAIERAAAHYCNSMIGLQRCADLKTDIIEHPPP